VGVGLAALVVAAKVAATATTVHVHLGRRAILAAEEGAISLRWTKRKKKKKKTEIDEHPCSTSI